MDIESLKKRKKDLEDAFKVAKATHKELTDRLNVNLEKQIEIRGAHQEIEKLIKDFEGAEESASN